MHASLCGRHSVSDALTKPHQRAKWSLQSTLLPYELAVTALRAMPSLEAFSAVNIDRALEYDVLMSY